MYTFIETLVFQQLKYSSEPYLQEKRSEHMIENLANNLIGSSEQKFIWPEMKLFILIFLNGEHLYFCQFNIKLRNPADFCLRPFWTFGNELFALCDIRYAVLKESF